jgi:predicted AAA+ superfamily ATPase
MKRKIYENLLKDLTKKMVFLVGPRQVGKTWLSKEIAKKYKNPLYLNFDSQEHREIIKKQSWLDTTDLIVFDELHKMPKWKNYLKGVYDTKKAGLHILITGSARLDAFRKTGDSLAGRFYIHHLMPFDLKELTGTRFENNIDRLMERSGFPEPFLADETGALKWRSQYTDSLLKLDVLEFQDIDKINIIKQLFDILKTKVGSTISYNNIAKDLNISPITVKKYVDILEALFLIFIIRPYSNKINRAILKEPKIYFYDLGLIKEEGIKFENFIALSFLTYIKELNDTTGKSYKLSFLKTKDKREVDFAISDEENNLKIIVETKLSDDGVVPNLKYFTDKYSISGIQLVKNLKIEKKIIRFTT